MNQKSDTRPASRRYPQFAVACEHFAGEQGDDDLIKLVDDHADAGDHTARGAPPLVVLVVDDDRDVHDSTRIALSGARVLGRRIEFVHAYSAEQARTAVTADETISVMLLDVVMETQDAGLRLIADLRAEIDHRDIRVIIRTGQPGYVPDRHFEENQLIDGFLLKSRLTRAMLLDAITAALAPRGNATMTPC